MTETTMKTTSDQTDFGNYVSLLKPRVMSLVVFTAAVGLVVAPGSMNLVLAFASVLFIALGAGASGSLNMWWDADIDRIMKRTQDRPVPSGKVSANNAMLVGLWMSVISIGMLGLASNWLAAALLAFTIFFYAVIYSMWLKRSTPQNIVIGGAAGAAPPVLGWTAVAGSAGIEYALLLFLIVFIWTPPHFWALAIHRVEEYRKVEVPMLPVTHGLEYTRTQILLYTALLFVVTLLPYLTGMSGLIYLTSAVVLGLIFLAYAIKICREPENPKIAFSTFMYSVNYLMILFVALLVDHYLLVSFL